MNRRKKGMFARRKGGRGSRNRNNRRRTGMPPENMVPVFRKSRRPYRNLPSKLIRVGTDSSEVLIRDYLQAVREDLVTYRYGEGLGTAQLEMQIERDLRTLKDMVGGDHEDYRAEYERLVLAYESVVRGKPLP